MTEIEVPVLIVGAGPVGLLGAQLLGRRGIRTLVAEKHEARLDAPKAHALNPRSLEICAAAGLPMDAIHAAATPAEEGGFIRMISTLASPEIGSLPYERQDDAVRALTPWPLINIEQPKFEAILECAVTRLPGVEIRKGLEWLRCDQLTDAVISTLLDRTTGEELKVRSRYLIAADGAGSTVRDGVGIQMDGPADLQQNMMIHFEADLRGLVADKPAILYFLFGPGPGGVLIAYDIGRTWVLMHPYRPDARTPESFTGEVCREIVLAAVGAPVPDLQIKGARSWSMSAQVAKRYRTGNAFLAGDAGHRFPPTGGLGLNTGIGDIDNLAWKIAAVESGWAGTAILDSYGAERRGIAQTNMSQSLANAMRIRAVFDALGYGPDMTVDASTFEARLADPEARARIDAAVAHQKDHFDSLRLQLGYAYGDALKADAALPISAFTPKAVVGARLPHVALGGAGSTLDLVGGEGFTLMAGPSHEAWRAVVAHASLPVALVVEGRDFNVHGGSWAARMGLGPDGALLVRPDGHILCAAHDASDTASVTQALAAYVKARLRRRHRRRGRARAFARCLWRRGYSRQQQRRSAAGPVRGLGRERLDRRDQRQHAARADADPGCIARYARAQVRPYRQHYERDGEIASGADGALDGGAHCAHRRLQGAGARGRRRQCDDQQSSARAFRHRPSAADGEACGGGEGRHP